MVENIIAIINFNSKSYLIYRKDESIKYALLSDGKISNSIDEKDIEILNNFYNLIKYNSKTSVFCGTFKIKGEEYEIYQDLRSTLYTFVLKKDGKRYFPSAHNIELLNLYFNEEQFVLYSKKRKIYRCNRAKKQKRIKFIKKILKVNGLAVAALISSSLITYNLPQAVRCDFDYEIGRVFRADLTQKNKLYTFEDIVMAVDRNKNISQEEKEFIKEYLKDEFEENKEYMDIEKIIKRLESFDVKYDRYYTYNKQTGEYEPTHSNERTLTSSAYYNVVVNKITCIEPSYSKSKIEEKIDDEFKFDNVDKSTYFHELNHMFSNFDGDSALSNLSEEVSFLEANDFIRTETGIFEYINDDMQKNYRTEIFRETINEIFSQEYVEKYYQNIIDPKREIGYSNALPYIYCLIEILPDDVIREYKFNDNDSVLTEGLLKICNNKEEAYKLMTALKSMSLYDDLVFRAQTDNNWEGFKKNRELFDLERDEVKQAKLDREENYKRIHDGLAFFYKARYNREMSDDMNMLIYLYNTPAITDEEKKKVQDIFDVSEENSKIVFRIKGYFSKEYMEKHPNLIISYNDKDNFYRTIMINNDIRYLDKDEDMER